MVFMPSGVEEHPASTVQRFIAATGLGKGLISGACAESNRTL
jgi:hypothetical protein